MDTILTALSKLENNIMNNELVISNALNELNSRLKSVGKCKKRIGKDSEKKNGNNIQL